MKQIKEGYKQTKVGIIPQDWEEYLFDDIFIFSTGKNIKQNEASLEFNIPCVRYGELYHMYNEVISTVINKTNLDKSELLFSKGDEILLPSAGEDPLDIGSASALTLANIAIGRTINILRPAKDNVYSQKYVSYHINQQLKNKISTLAKGSSISNVYNSDLKKLRISLPPLKEQEKIAEILTTWDNAIIKQQELIKSKEEQKKGLMQRLLIGEVRFDGFSDEWKEVTIDELFTFKKGQALSKEKLDEKGIFECILYGELYTTYSEIIKEIKSKTNIEEGIKSKVDDILIPASTTTTAIDLAIASVVQKENVLIGGDINILRKKINNINGEFIAKYLTHIKKIEIAKYAQGITIIHLYSKDFKHLKINLPSLFEQQKIAEVLSLADEEINNLKNELKEQKQQKKALMQKLLTGQVRVNV